jgi:hypothetical protein
LIEQATQVEPPPKYEHALKDMLDTQSDIVGVMEVYREIYLPPTG